MGTSVQMLMSNYAQVPDNKDKEKYKGLGDLWEEQDKEEAEEYKPKKRAAPRTTTKSNKKAKK